MDSNQNIPSGTAVPPSGTALPPSGTALPPSATAVAPSGTALPPSGTSVPPPSGTAVPPSGTAVAPGTGTAVAPGTGTALPPKDAQPGTVTSAQFTTITIDGVTYTNKGLIYNQSSEACLYKVEAAGRLYALKLYNLHHHPNHEVLERIKQIPNGNGLIIDLYAHGVWDAPDGQHYDYELMRLCAGKSLASRRPLKQERNGEKQLVEIAIRMAAEIDYCHKNGVLHRDIKPANFLYEDDKQTSFVLTDFGIGKLLGNDGVAYVDIGRTPTYAAPETYIVVPGAKLKATPAADFYSMGISLLVLWMGEGIFTSKSEDALFREKQSETLPYPTDKEMSRHMLSLIKALTHLLEDKRPTYEDIERWAQGEDVFGVEQAKFEVSFTSQLTAHSPAELAQMMQDNQDLAKRYLYKEQLEKMLREAHYPELAQSMSEITEDLYPGDKDAGLYAACLALDKDMGYTGLQGNGIKTAKEMANELMNNDAHYVQSLVKPTHFFWVYLQSIGGERLVKKYTTLIAKEKMHALHQLCYELNPQLPFVFEKFDTRYQIDDLNQLTKELKDGTFSGSTNLDALVNNAKPIPYITLLAKNDFLTWLSGQNPALAGAALQTVSAARGTANDEDLGWRVAYTVAADTGYDFLPLTGKNASKLGTTDSIARQMAVEINEGKTGSGSLTAQIDQSLFTHSRLYQYLVARKKYDSHISWIQYCMNLMSDDNSRKAGPYNTQIAQMKTVAGLLGTTFPLTVGNTTLNSLSDYINNRTAINNAATGNKAIQLQNWLALQYQENPKAKLSDGNYSKLTYDYTEQLMTSLPDSQPGRSAWSIAGAIATAKEEFNSAIGRVKTYKTLAIVLGYVPLALISIFLIYNLLFNIGSDSFKGLMESIGNILGWIVGIIGGLACCAGGIIAGVIGGVLLYFLTSWLVGLLTPLIPWLLVAALLAIMAFFWLKVFGNKMFGLNDTWSTMDLDDAERKAIMGAAFGTRDKLLPGLPDDYPACVYSTSAKNVRSGHKSYLISVVSMIIISAVILLVFIWANSSSGSKADQITTEASVEYPDVSGIYQGTFDGCQATMELRSEGYNNYEGQVVIRYRRTLTQQVHGEFDSEGRLILAVLDNNGQQNTTKVYVGSAAPYDSGIMEYSGTYYNTEKNSQIQFVFTRE